jgi:predicted ribosomally synthesized peptide with SipW-like signal peptide
MQTKKKVLIGGLSSLAVAAGVALTGGTSAYYYDLERSEGNRFAACSLDLRERAMLVKQVAFAHDDGDGTTGESVEDTQASSNVSDNGDGALSTISLSNLQPGDAFEVKIGLRNAGSCAGEMWGDINFPINDFENEPNPEPEAEWQALGNDPDNGSQDGVGNPDTDGTDGGQGDLDDVMQVSFSDDEGNSFNGSFHELAYEYPWRLDDDFQPDETNVITVMLTVPDSGEPGDGNEIMGDSYEFAIDFAAAQKNKITPSPEGVGVDLNNMGTPPVGP